MKQTSVVNGYPYGKNNQPSIHLTTSKILLLVTLTLITLTVIPLYFPFHKFPSLSPSTHSSTTLSPLSHHDHDDKLITIDDNHHKCDVYTGEWIPNPNAPYYQNTTCWAIHEHQNCQKYSRPDSDFMKWKWKPDECDLPLFNPYQFLEIVRDKSLAFVGDSVGRNQMQSLICMLSRKFRHIHCLFPLSPCLVKYNQPDTDDPTHTSIFSLYLDEFDENWINHIDEFNYLILNGGHWFSRPAFYYENRKVVGCKYCQKENITDYPMTFGCRRALRTAFKGIMSRKNFKGVAILRAFAPTHFEGGEWNGGGDCTKQKPYKSNEVTLEGSNLELYLIQMEEFKKAQRKATENGMKFRIMDITQPMLLRPDGHPSKYGHWPNENVTLYNDCVHWCLPGPIDTLSDFLPHMVKMEGRRSAQEKLDSKVIQRRIVNVFTLFFLFSRTKGDARNFLYRKV